jgi:hypothetical protein
LSRRSFSSPSCLPAARSPSRNGVIRRQGSPVTDEDRAWWTFQPLAAPALPPVARAGWAASPIDRFILASLEAAGLEPSPPAGKRELIRRAYFDLIGLPPPPAAVDAFLDDRAPDAWERLIDRLLASPHYGERWGRHWLDVVRFAQTNGYERDDEKPFAWRYRDWPGAPRRPRLRLAPHPLGPRPLG